MSELLKGMLERVDSLNLFPPSKVGRPLFCRWMDMEAAFSCQLA